MKIIQLRLTLIDIFQAKELQHESNENVKNDAKKILKNTVT